MVKKTAWKPESIAFAAQVVDIDCFAAIVGVATTHIRSLCIDKTLPAVKQSRGRRPGWWLTLSEAIPAYMEYRLKLEKVKRAEMLAKAEEERKGPKDDIYMRRETAKSEILETKTRVIKGKLVSTDAVLKILNDDYSQVRNTLVNLPGRLCRIIAGKSDPVEIEELLESEVETAIKALRDHFEREFHSSADPQILREMEMIQSAVDEAETE